MTEMKAESLPPTILRIEIVHALLVIGLLLLLVPCASASAAAAAAARGRREDASRESREGGFPAPLPDDDRAEEACRFRNRPVADRGRLRSSGSSTQHTHTLIRFVRCKVSECVR